MSLISAPNGAIDCSLRMTSDQSRSIKILVLNLEYLIAFNATR